MRLIFWTASSKNQPVTNKKKRRNSFLVFVFLHYKYIVFVCSNWWAGLLLQLMLLCNSWMKINVQMEQCWLWKIYSISLKTFRKHFAWSSFIVILENKDFKGKFLLAKHIIRSFRYTLNCTTRILRTLYLRGKERQLSCITSTVRKIKIQRTVLVSKLLDILIEFISMVTCWYAA